MCRELIWPRASVCQANRFRKQAATGGRKRKSKKHQRQHTAAMACLVKRGVIRPERSVQHFVLQLCLGSEHESPAIVGAGSVQLEVEVTYGVRIVELNAGDLTGYMTHVVATERPIDTAKMLGVTLLKVEQQPGRLYAASGENDLTSLDRTRASRCSNGETLRSLLIT